MTTTTDVAEPSFRRAVVLMTATSFLVPAGGVITAPLLAHALSTDGRGELAAALAPAGLMLAAATFGLPDSLTFFLAKRPEVTRRLLTWASSITFTLGLVCVVGVWFAVPFLRDGNRHLGRLILLGAVLTIPALIIGVFRGAATGRQMWGAVAAERLINTVVRVAACVVLFVIHDLTLVNAVLVNLITPLISGIAYFPLLRESPLAGRHRPGASAALAHRSLPSTSADVADPNNIRTILTFGTRVWFGSVVSMVLDRADALLMAPLSNVADLGVFTVAGTISDMPLIVALAIAGALFGVNSQSANIAQITNTSRLTLLTGILGCGALGASLPWLVGPLFGNEFKASTVPTLMLMSSALICIPGLMAASGLAAWGRPGLRSIGLGLTLVVNLGLFVLLVPIFGVYGGCWTSIVSNVVMTGYMLAMSRRVMGVPASQFYLIRWADVLRTWSEGLRLWHRLVPSAARS